MKASKTGLITAPLSNPEINVATGTCNTTQCPTQECTEVFKSDCVLYTGPDLSCQSTTIVNTDDTVTEAIQSVVDYFCANGGGGGIGAQGAQGPQGAQGSQGTQGVQGVQGRIGSQGAQGPQGTQGVQGLRGMQGVQGPQGTQGIQGSQGIQGIQGSQGVQGIQGSKGVNGLQGAQGPQGLDGQYAAQGVQGPQGSQGVQGIQGSVGLQGTSGEQGGYGPTGLQGAQGPQGVQGAQGIGNNGAQGPQGPQGSQGIQGGGFNQSQGTQGTQGSIGTQGITGTGSQGAQGPQGSLGTQGTIGTSIQGTRGSQGLQGSQGSQGTQGVQGIDGLFAGQGAQGATGIQGPEGVQGPAGSGGGGTGGGRCSTDSTLIASTSGFFVSQGDGVTFIGNNEFCGWNGCEWSDARECNRDTPYTSLTNTIPVSIDLALYDEVRICGSAIFDQYDPLTDDGEFMVGLGAIRCENDINNFTTRCLIDPTTNNQRFNISDYGYVCFDKTYIVETDPLGKCKDRLAVYLGMSDGLGTLPAHIKFTFSLTAIKTCVDTYYDAVPCCAGPVELAYGTYIIGYTYVDSITGKCFTVAGYGSAGTPTVSLVSGVSYNDCGECITVYPCPS